APIEHDSFHAETNLCGICRGRRARVSFAHFGGTAVSARQTEFALASETHNERHAVTGGVEGPLASTGTDRLLEDILAKSPAPVGGKDCEGPLRDIVH